MPIVAACGNEDKTPARQKKESASGKKHATHSILRISIDGKSLAIQRDDLRDADRYAALELKLRQANVVVIKNISALLALEPAVRLWLLNLLARLSDGAYLRDGDQPRSDIFDAVLMITADLHQMSQADAWRSAVLEAAVARYPTALDLACGRIRERFKELGHQAPRRDSLVSDAKKILAAFHAAYRRSHESPTVKALFPDAPVSDEVRVPTGWGMSLNGITKIDTDEIVIAKGPILIVERSRHIRDEVEHVTLAWMSDGRWQTRIVPRAVIADRKKLVELAAFGLPITSNNAASLVAFLADFEAENAVILPVAIVTEQQGWLTINGETVFFCGHTLIRENPQLVAVETNVNALTAPTVRFLATDSGNEQIAKAVTCRGTFSTWKQAIDKLHAFPKVLLALNTSFAAPLIKILGIASFIVDWVGETSTGKTTSLRVGASVWGNPCESGSAAPSFVFTWDATPTFLERTAETVQNEPLIVDETKRAQYAIEQLPKAVYAFCAGRGRGRGSPDGVRSSGTWATTMLSSGEQPLTSFTRDGGTHARVIEVWGGPFGKANETTAQIVRTLTDALQENFGHAGPQFVRWLLRHRAEWRQIRRRYREIRASLTVHSGRKSLAIRLCDSMAAIVLAEELSHQAMKLPSGRMMPLCVELLRQVTETDRAAEALRWVLDWSRKNQHRFFKKISARRESMEPEIGRDFVGRWDPTSGAFLGVIPGELKKVLEAGGFDLESVVNVWRDRGWLHLQGGTDGKHRTRYRAQIGSDRNARVIAIRHSAIVEVDPPGDDPDVDQKYTDQDDG